MAKYAKRDLDDVPSSGNREARKKPTDVAELYPLPDGKYARLRFLPGVVSYGGHWVNTVNKEGKKASFFVTCSAWSMDSGTRQGGNGVGHCPFCEQEAREQAAELDPAKRTSRFGIDHFMNAIVRSKQKSKPEDAGKPTPSERKSGIKEKDSDAWTPVYAVRLPNSMIRSMKDLKQLNVQEDENGDSKAFPVSHAEYGRDVSIMKDTSKPAAQMYAAQLGEASPLTEKELKYLIQPIDDLMDFIKEDELRAEYDKWATKMGIKTIKKAAKKAAVDDDEDDLEDEDLDDDDAPATKSKKPAAKAKKKVVDEDDDEASDDEDDEDTPPPKKPAKKPVKKVVDEDDDLDDDDEDDEPKAKAKKPAKKVVEEDDDDEDGDEDDEDTPPPKKSVKKPVKKVVDDDEDDFDEDEEDAPPPKTKKPAAKPVAKKPAKKVVDEDEDDDLDDDDDDEEEAPPPKKSVKKPAAKAKKKPVDDDEDDELN